MNRIEEYVYKSFKEIPDSDRKTRLTQDIISDMEEMVADLMAAGKAEEDAVNKAIIEFGDISDLKAERDALQWRVFPRLRELCLQHGCHPQAQATRLRRAGAGKPNPRSVGGTGSPAWEVELWR
jgi:hypothetical protein